MEARVCPKCRTEAFPRAQSCLGCGSPLADNAASSTSGTHVRVLAPLEESMKRGTGYSLATPRRR